MTEEKIKREWILQNKKVCLCKGIPRKRFVAAIKKGAMTIEEINRVVGSGSGNCGGKRCEPVIREMLEASDLP